MTYIVGNPAKRWPSIVGYEWLHPQV